MDDPFGYLNLLQANIITPEMYDEHLYFCFIERGLHLTAEVFRREIGSHFEPYVSPWSPTTPLSPIGVENLPEWILIINEAGQVEWEALLEDDGSSYSDDDSLWQQSRVAPSIDHGLNEQPVEELNPNEIFDGTDNQGPISVVEACQSSNIVTNEKSCVKAKEDDTQDFVITNDPIELSTLVNGKKIEERNSYSQDAYLYDSSSFDLGNEDDGVISFFSFNEYHEALYSGEIQGVTVGGNLICQPMPHPKRVMLFSNPASIEDTDTPGPHSLAQTVPRTTESALDEHGDGGVYVPGGTPVPFYMKNFPNYSSFCSKRVGASCSQDANMHDSSLSDKGNEDNDMISIRNIHGHHVTSKNDDSKGMITGGNLPEITTNTEYPILCLPPLNLDVTGTERLDTVDQAILRSVEISTNESGRKRKWFEESGDDDVSLCSGSN